MLQLKGLCQLPAVVVLVDVDLVPHSLGDLDLHDSSEESSRFGVGAN